MFYLYSIELCRYRRSSEEKMFTLGGRCRAVTNEEITTLVKKQGLPEAFVAFLDSIETLRLGGWGLRH